MVVIHQTTWIEIFIENKTKFRLGFFIGFLLDFLSKFLSKLEYMIICVFRIGYFYSFLIFSFKMTGVFKNTSKGKIDKLNKQIVDDEIST